jgi:Rad3-related DNA helicase
MPVLAGEIDNIANYHFGEKGLVHVTYGMAEMLRKHLAHNDRYVFHDRNNKTEMYEHFRSSPEPLVLFACGMYEGIDLPDDAGRWQIIAKTPYKSLGDPAIAYKAEKDQDWYNWSALKDLIQACGRVCRHEKDRGVTYILDKSAIRLVNNNSHLIPQWFRDALDAGNE